MTISNTSERRAGPYATNGSDVEFEFEFKVFADEDLVVTSAEDGVDTVLEIEVDYTVELNADQEDDPGGVVTLLTAPDGPTITIISDMDYTQPTVFTNSGGFYPRVLNNSLDRATILIQQLKELVSRALIAPFGAEGQAGQYVVVLPDGTYGYSSGTGADAGLREDLAEEDGSALVSFSHEATYGAGTIGRALKRTISVTDAPYNAVGDGETDDSDAIQAAVDANKGGTIILPAGYTFLAAGTTLTGSTYNGTSIVVEGTYKLAPSGGVPNFGGSSPLYGGIVVHDCEDVTIDVPGVIDGNRAEQTAWEQHHCLVFWGARNFRVPQFNAREVRGDGIVISSATNLAPMTTNSKNGVIGPVRVINTADDGRNAVSIISGENITLAGGVSIAVGGIIDSVTMPGGLDIEPDGDWHLVKNITSGPWVIETAGTSGIAVLGAAITDDATRDWNVSDVYIAPSIVHQTANTAGAPIFRRVLRGDVDVTSIRTGTRQSGVEIDFVDYCSFKVHVKGASKGVTIGFLDYVNDCDIRVEVDDHSAAGLLVVGANRSRFTGYVRGATSGADRFGVQASVASRGTLTQIGVIYSVDVPYDANNVYGFVTSASLTFTDCVICDCALLGYSDYSAQFGFTTYLPTRNVQGRNWSAVVPATGYWIAGDRVENTAVAAAGAPGWVCTTGGNPGTWKARANVAS